MKRQDADSRSRLIDADDCTGAQRGGMVAKNVCNRGEPLRRIDVLSAKQDHTRPIRPRERQQAREIEVMRQQHGARRARLVQDLGIVSLG